MRRVQLDHNASAPLRPEVRQRLAELLGGDDLGNPSSVHAAGRAARDLLEDARERLAVLLGRPRDQLVFTSGGSESNNLALTAGRTVAVAADAHPSATAPGRARGGRELPVAPDGSPRLEALSGCDLLSVVHGHHETGHLLDLAALANHVHDMGGRLHVDACQSFGRVELASAAADVDLLSVSAHKLGGPVGVGALIVGTAVHPEALIRGGEQELGLRAGTEPAWLAAGFALAAELACEEREQRRGEWLRLRTELLTAIRRYGDDVRVISPADGLANTLCLSFPGRPGATLVRRLDLSGVCVSHGSACASGSDLPSPALAALGHDDAVTRGSLRVSMGVDTDDADIAAFVAALDESLESVPRRDTR